MSNSEKKSEQPVVLITGGAKRIGKHIALLLHKHGYRIMVHYRSSANAAHQLVDELNSKHDNTADAVAADLIDVDSIPEVVSKTIEKFGRLDALINNASTFYPTPIELIEQDFWNDLVGSNFRAPAFLVKSAAPHLRETNGSIINIVDIYATRPLNNHPIYCSAKAGLQMLTKSLARDLAPYIRVNGVAPGAIIWPEDGNSEVSQSELVDTIPLGRMGDPMDVAKTIRFLIEEGTYITGQIIAVDGGRSVTI